MNALVRTSVSLAGLALPVASSIGSQRHAMVAVPLSPASRRGCTSVRRTGTAAVLGEDEEVLVLGDHQEDQPVDEAQEFVEPGGEVHLARFQPGGQVGVGLEESRAQYLERDLDLVGQARNWPIAAPILSMLPYLGTIGLIIVPVLAWHRVRRLMAAPAALGEAYYRDAR